MVPRLSPASLTFMEVTGRLVLLLLRNAVSLCLASVLTGLSALLSTDMIPAIPTHPCEVSAIGPIRQMGKLSHREVL